MIDINDLLRIMVERKASDLHLRVGSPPIMRVNGMLEPYGEERLSIQWINDVAEKILTDRQKHMLREDLAVDSSYSIESFIRFRLNVFYQRGTLSMAFRNIFTSVPTIDSLGLPTVLASFCEKPQGLIIVSGPTGAGKSTTLAAMLQYINTTRKVHIVTIEDPIEYLFRDDKAFITQREIGIDAPDYDTALKNALRQDPDVILIGELRSRQTMQTALNAAETGHLVLSTVHANSASEAISRIVDAFPGDTRQLIRKQIADVLVASVYQRLLQTKQQTGRVPAVEILIKTPRIKELIERNELREIREEMERSVVMHRMQSFEQSLIALIANKVIGYQEAISATLLPGEMKLAMDQLGIDENGDVHIQGVIADEGVVF
ncbi:MAG: PilT/PilU family type 4a pilus ATPase [Desulfobacterota bacterium]|nr:PilT/PilU family type 4a pilus ATPase [Thermodesulfobacteriota bacterium]